MSKFPELFPGVRVGPQPTDEDIDQLQRAGIRTVIDFRLPGETSTPNEDLVGRYPLSYTNIPTSRDNPSASAVERLDQVMSQQPGPYLLHCGSGIRAITLYLLREAQRQGWSAERVEQEAASRSYELASAPALKKFVHDQLS